MDIYIYKNIESADIEQVFLFYALDVNLYLTPESNVGLFAAMNEYLEKNNLPVFNSWRDYYDCASKDIYGCDQNISKIVRMEQIHIFGEEAPTLCWYGLNPTFGTDKRYYGFIPILFSSEDKEQMTPVYATNGQPLFFEFTEDYATYLNDTFWHYEDFEYNELNINSK